MEKKRLGHGNFEAFVSSDLPFSLATAKNYRMVFRMRETVKQLTFSGLSDLYRQLRRLRKRKPVKVERSTTNKEKEQAADPPKERPPFTLTKQEEDHFNDRVGDLMAAYEMDTAKEVVLAVLDDAVLALRTREGGR